MPFGKWESFEDCVRDFVSQGKTEESAKRICGALKARLEEEAPSKAFSWDGNTEPQRGKLIHGKAIHPIKTFHPEEWPGVRVYLEEELEKAAGSLAGVPLLLDHVHPLDGRVLDASYEDGAVEYVAELKDDQVLSLVKNGAIRHCSVEYEWDNLKRLNGVAPRGITFTGLALLRDFEPGDPEATVEVWEGIVRRLKEASESRLKEQIDLAEFIFFMVRDPAAFTQEDFSTVWVDRTNGIQGIYGRLKENPENPQPLALLFMKSNGWTAEKVQSWVRDHPEYTGNPQASPADMDVQVLPAPQVAQSIKEAFGAVNSSIHELAERTRKDYQALESRLNALEKLTAQGNQLGEAIIDPSDDQRQGFVGKAEVLAKLREACYERVPRHWSYGAYLQNRRLKELIKLLENSNSDGRLS